MTTETETEAATRSFIASTNFITEMVTATVKTRRDSFSAVGVSRSSNRHCGRSTASSARVSPTATATRRTASKSAFTTGSIRTLIRSKNRAISIKASAATMGTVAVTTATHTAPAVFCSGVGSIRDRGRPITRRAATSEIITPTISRMLAASHDQNREPVRRAATSDDQSFAI